mgnify:CR=1 FL=1
MLPLDFIENLHEQMTPEEVQALCQALESEQVTSIRLNDKLDYLTFDCDTEEVPWHEDGYYLSRRPQFTLVIERFPPLSLISEYDTSQIFVCGI